MKKKILSLTPIIAVGCAYSVDSIHQHTVYALASSGSLRKQAGKKKKRKWNTHAQSDIFPSRQQK